MKFRVIKTSSSISFYHIKIIYRSGADVDYAYEVNLSEEQATEILAQIEDHVPEITFDGRTIFPKRIKERRVFLTESPFSFSSQRLHNLYPEGYRGDFEGREVTREILTKLASPRKKRVVPHLTRVFISSRIEELKKERDKAEKIIDYDLNLIPVRSEYWEPRSKHTEAVCRQEVRNSHIILFILGKEFSQMVRNEYNEAITPPKKDVLVFLKDLGKADREPELVKFIGDIEEFWGGRQFKNIEDFGEMVRGSIISVFEDRYHRVKEKGLVIEFDPTNSNLLGLVNYEDTPLVRKFTRVEVWNYGEETAKNVKGFLKVVGEKYLTCKLHFANTPESTSEPVPVDIRTNDFKMLDVIFSQIEESSNLELTIISGFHYLGTSPGWGGTISPTLMSNLSQALEAKNEGCYIATNEALRRPRRYNQFYLPPGEHIVEVKVSADNFEPISKTFQVFSPRDPKDLEVQIQC